jgi:hypothetical protein
MACTKWALPLYKRGTDKVIITSEFEISDSDDSNASVVSELEHQSGTSKPEPTATTSSGKMGNRGR